VLWKKELDVTESKVWEMSVVRDNEIPGKSRAENIANQASTSRLPNLAVSSTKLPKESVP